MPRLQWILATSICVLLSACDTDSSEPSDEPGSTDEPGAADADGGSDEDDASDGYDASDGEITRASDAAAEAASRDAALADTPDAASGPSGTSDASTNDRDSGAPLPDGTLLYIRHATPDQDVIVARNLERGDEHIVTDLTADGSKGWEIDGYSLSPDRRRLALASLFHPTAADTATGLATRAIWTLAIDGTDFRRLTPTFPKADGGRQGFQYDVGDPEWTADGSQVVYDFGSYWWEGTTLKGASFPWIVPADASRPPAGVPTPADCSVLHVSRNPATGDFLAIHSVCIPGQGEGNGLYLYAANDSTAPKKLVASGRSADSVDIFLAKASWFADGSGFVFIAGSEQTSWRPSLFAYDLTTQLITPVAAAPEGSAMYSVAVSPDASKLVYCLRQDDGAVDLHLIDLGAATAVVRAITADGKSCFPSF